MNKRILSCIFQAMDVVNGTLPEKLPDTQSLQSVLYGHGGLDSISLVLLISLIEQNLEDEFHRPFILANEKAISSKNSPFLTVHHLHDYILELLQADL